MNSKREVGRGEEWTSYIERIHIRLPHMHEIIILNSYLQ